MWTKAGVIAILKETKIGTEILKKILKAERDGKVKIYSADMRYKYIYDAKLPRAKPDFNDKDLKGWKTNVVFGIGSNRGYIHIHKDLDNFTAAWTLVHEGTHYLQQGYDYVKYTHEIEAFTMDAKFILQKQEWITKEKLGASYSLYVNNFFKGSKGKYTLNPRGIFDYVDANYVKVFGDPAYRRTNYAYEGPPLKRTNWNDLK
jgi:hypothetical protein